VSGNPTFSLPVGLTFTGKTITGGTFNSGNFNGVGNFTSVTSSGPISTTGSQSIVSSGNVFSRGTVFEGGNGAVILQPQTPNLAVLRPNPNSSTGQMYVDTVGNLHVSGNVLSLDNFLSSTGLAAAIAAFATGAVGTYAMLRDT